MKRLLLTGLMLLAFITSPEAATKLKFSNDVTGALEEAQGSDGRLNTSSRSDSRAYYNSRDDGQSYSLVYNETNILSGSTIAYWKNTSTTKTLVISSVGINATTAGLYELNFVTGTASGTYIHLIS